jgi:glycosyltransferase involved in cell wall biosynthesis
MKTPDKPQKIRFSVVIPCYNGAAGIRRQIESILDLGTEHIGEIIVADNCSTDSTREIVSALAAENPRVRYIEAFRGQGINFGRNDGVRASKFEHVLLCDADDSVFPEWDIHHASAFRAGATLVGGTLVATLPSGEILRTIDYLYDGLWDGMPWPGGANCGFTRAIFDEIGGFDESYRGGGDDTDFFWRALLRGSKITFVPEAKIAYFERESSKEVFRQRMGYGFSEVKLFNNFRMLGMPRQHIFRAPIGVFAGVLGCAFSTPSSKRRYVAAARLGRNWGRIKGSWHFRHWYF